MLIIPVFNIRILMREQGHLLDNRNKYSTAKSPKLGTSIDSATPKFGMKNVGKIPTFQNWFPFYTLHCNVPKSQEKKKKVDEFFTFSWNIFPKKKKNVLSGFGSKVGKI